MSNNNIINIIINKGNFAHFCYSQILVSIAIIQTRRKMKIDTILFVFGQDLLIVPILLSKILKINVFIRSDGRPTVILKKYLNDKNMLKFLIFKLIEAIDYRLSSCVITECQYMIRENKFDRYPCARVGNLFVDTHKFSKNNSLEQRQYDIGFIGRFSEEKGIINFLYSIRILFQGQRPYSVFIAGDGDLRSYVHNVVGDLNGIYINNITMSHWVDSDEMPYILNNIKLIVLPSSREGLPNMALEAMACGTIVLATPVGGIPDIVHDGSTGYLMRNNEPDVIADNIVRALDDQNCQTVSNEAITLIEKGYSFSRALTNWEKIFGS